MNMHRQSSQQCYEGTIFTPPPKKNYIFDEIHGYWCTLVDITVITFQLHLTCYWSEKLKDPDECARRWKVTGSWYKCIIDEYQLLIHLPIHSCSMIVCSSETQVPTPAYQTKCYKPADHNMNFFCHVNLKSHTHYSISYFQIKIKKNNSNLINTHWDRIFFMYIDV
jgi:hypothetical protein